MLEREALIDLKYNEISTFPIRSFFEENHEV